MNGPNGMINRIFCILIFIGLVPSIFAESEIIGTWAPLPLHSESTEERYISIDKLSNGYIILYNDFTSSRDNYVLYGKYAKDDFFNDGIPEILIYKDDQIVYIITWGNGKKDEFIFYWEYDTPLPISERFVRVQNTDIATPFKNQLFLYPLMRD
ncbi:MAG: hypothetical protein MI717_13205 [Spirochaetales bacterium]|nr:hypothetical protein [Spirochaetales bacterium]